MFGLTGIFNTLSNLLVSWSVFYLSESLSLALSAGYIFSVPIHFYLNYKVVFDSDKKVSLALVRYLSVVFFSYSFSYFFIYMLGVLFGAHFFLASFINVFVVAALSFLLFRRLL